jgi:hypothetical protein
MRDPLKPLSRLTEAMNSPLLDHNMAVSRRQFFRRHAMGLGGVALGSLIGQSPGGFAHAAATGTAPSPVPGFRPRAKRAIYLSMLGAPSQMDLFDYKPGLNDLFDTDLPDSIRQGQRITGMTSGQSRLPVAPSMFKFQQYGECRAWVSELMPWTAKMVDDLCFIKSMYTEAINHEPANQLIYTGSMQSGKASLGSWLSYGLGSLNENLPTFVVLHARHTSPFSNVQAISGRLWGAGFLPAHHAGVALRSVGDPVLYLQDPAGVSRETRRRMLDGLGELNRMTFEKIGDPETEARLKQYEMAFRMQASVPELADTGAEPEETFELYGPEARDRGSFANSCLMARRLLERGVRFVQIFHRGWDQHGNLPRDLRAQCGDVDRACYGLVQDLKRRGLLEDTMVIWGGEFGRTVYCQGALHRDNYGRDHHPRAFTIWATGGGIKPGIVHGETDDYSYNITRDPVHIRDLHATILHQFGIKHDALSFKFQGLDQKLTGVDPARVVKEILI